MFVFFKAKLLYNSYTPASLLAQNKFFINDSVKQLSASDTKIKSKYNFLP